MNSYVLRLPEVDRSKAVIVGGKAAQLGELMRIEGIRVPPGFCVTTEVFNHMTTDVPEIEDQLDRLARLKADVGEAIRTPSAAIRRTRSDRHPGGRRRNDRRPAT